MKLLLIIMILMHSLTGFTLEGGKTSDKSPITRQLITHTFNYKGCGYTRISKKVFITAAHCTKVIQDPEVFDAEISFGEASLKAKIDFIKKPFINWNDYLTLYDYEQLIKFPTDLAVIHIAEHSLEKIKAIQIAKINIKDSLAPGDIIHLTGYGCHQDLPGKRLSDGRFRTRSTSVSAIDNGFAYSSSTSVRICPGDSGSAIFNARLEVVGINSARKKKELLKYSMITRLDPDARTEHANLADQSMEPNDWLKTFLE